MKLITIAAAAGLMLASAPAFAQTSDSITTIIAKGAIINVGGTDYDVTYKPDGTFISNGAPGGTYKVDGKKLCHTAVQVGQEACTELPEGKKSGDTFDLTSDVLGPMKFKIK